MNIEFTKDAARKLVKLLRKHKYDVTSKKNGQFYVIEGNNIFGGFHLESDMCQSKLNCRLAADHRECFDKWEKCPLVIKLPCEDSKILDNLKMLSIKEGYEYSNNFDYIYQEKRFMPYEIGD